MESKAPFERFLAMDILESRGVFARVMMPCKQELTNPEQAARISGITPAAIFVLQVYLKKHISK